MPATDALDILENGFYDCPLMSSDHLMHGTWSAWAAAWPNLTAAGVLLGAAVLQRADFGLYYRTVQEDGSLEWTTFWFFVAAAIVFIVAGSRQRRSIGRFPWFLWGVAAFSLFVALEEISWGQRVLGYRPPDYFLRENFQQELNIHNVFSTALRKFMLKAVILGYGVVLPVIALPRLGRDLLGRLGVVVPPLALAPAFLATFLLYQSYPWRYSGELVELMLGMGLLFGGFASLGDRSNRSRAGGRLAPMIAATVATALLGVASAAASQLGRSDSPELIAAAETELAALAGDLAVRGGRLSRCGLHKRIFTFYEKYGHEELRRGAFARLVAAGLPEQRAEYFIDPWNSAIWIRHSCDHRSQRQAVFVYSFGPDRRRDSSSWEIVGDDIGVMIFEQGAPTRP